MDKRWIAILVIFIVGMSCMYFIVTNSPAIGTPIKNLNKSIVTIPNDFTAADENSDSLLLHNKSNTNENLYIQDLGKGNHSLEKFKNRLKSLPNEGNIKIIKNESEITPEHTIYTVYYQRLDNGTQYESITYMDCIKHTFYIKLYGFSSIESMDYPFNFVVDTLQPDYKRTQD